MQTEPIPRSGWRRLLPWLKAAVSAALLWYLFSRLDWHDVRALPASTPLLLLIGVGLNLAALMLMAGRWRTLLHATMARTFPLLALFRHYLVGAFYNTLLPGSIGGDVVRTRRLILQQGVDTRTAIRVALLERLIGLCGVAGLVAATLPWVRLPERWQAAVDVLPTHLLSLLGALACLVALVLLLRGFGAKSLGIVGALSVAVLVICAQLTDAAILALFLVVLGLHVTPPALVFCVGAAYIAAMLPISLGGLGVKEGVLGGLLTLHGVPLAIAILVPLALVLVRLCTAVLGAAVEFSERRA